MKRIKSKNLKRDLRKKRVRAKIRGTAERPRLSLFRSHRYLYAQLIDDAKMITIVSMSTRGWKETGKKIEQAAKLGALLGEKAKKLGIKSVVVDRGAYKYHGRIKAMAESFFQALK